MAPRARLPHEPRRRPTRDDRGGRREGRGVGGAAPAARLRDRRRRRQGRLVRAGGAARVAPPAAALGAGVQVGPGSGPDRSPRHPHPCRANRRPQPVGGARARGGRGRHRLDRDAPQRGGHQPQGHPRGRHRDRPASRRRDPAGRRTGAPACQGHQAVPDAREVPALRRGGREARGRGDASLSEPGLPFPGSRDAHPLGRGGNGHRGRRRAVRQAALERRAPALDAGSLPADAPSSSPVSTATARSRPRRRSRRSAARRPSPSSAFSSA